MLLSLCWTLKLLSKHLSTTEQTAVWLVLLLLLLLFAKSGTHVISLNISYDYQYSVELVIFLIVLVIFLIVLVIFHIALIISFISPRARSSDQRHQPRDKFSYLYEPL